MLCVMLRRLSSSSADMSQNLYFFDNDIKILDPKLTLDYRNPLYSFLSMLIDFNYYNLCLLKFYSYQSVEYKLINAH